MLRIAFATMVSLVACATTTKQGPEAATAGSDSEDVVCTDEAPTGTNISHRVCRPRAKSDEDRDAAQRTMQKPRPTPPPRGK